MKQEFKGYDVRKHVDDIKLRPNLTLPVIKIPKNNKKDNKPEETLSQLATDYLKTLEKDN